MYARSFSVAAALAAILALSACAVPQQQPAGQGQGPGYTQPIRTGQPTSGGQQQAAAQGQRQAPQMQESTSAAAGDQDTCRLLSSGKVLAEIKLPLSVKREEAKQICNEWQQREASARGLR